jgi:outer membrane biosynthesis protein TonB
VRAASLFALALTVTSSAAAQTSLSYSPPRLVRGDLPAVAPPNVVGGGQVVIEAIVDRRGMLTRPVIVRSTPPFSNLLLDAIGRWTFKPAEALRDDNTTGPVDATVLIAAVYRPPTVVNGPTLGEVPKDVAKPSTEVPYPTSLVSPPYPVNALHASIVLFEVLLDERGKITNVRAIGSDPGFDSAARDALMQWTFRPATYRARPAPAVAYVVFGFAEPVVGTHTITPGQSPGISSGR